MGGVLEKRRGDNQSEPLSAQEESETDKKRDEQRGGKKRSPGISLSSSSRSPKLLQLVLPPSILSHSFSAACQTSLKSLLILVTPETLILPLWLDKSPTPSGSV